MRFCGLSQVSRSAVVAVVAAAALSAGLASARATGPVSCGDTITNDATLTADLDCPADGLFVSGDAITLDLDGHTISGAGTGVGITVTATHLRIQNGTVRGFQQGVHYAHVLGVTDSFNVLSGLTVANNGVGVRVDLPGGSIEESKVSSNAGDGIALRGALLWTIKDSEVSNNGGAGISLQTAAATIERNSVLENAGNGIDLISQADTTTITDNRVARNGGFGIRVIDSTGQVLRNTVRNNGDTGILLSEGADPIFLPQYLIADNVSNRNGGHGIDAMLGMTDGGGNSARHNAVPPDCLNIACS